ncbi:MAG: hypothetical protein NZ695_05000 [Dehalococcoidia bacterium]|jgi:hypothetical protein|nr:hypothetical protein [Dehalococcoidia bacterium]MDW8008637.1 DUF3303 family protein [Chloroflexota bacterium]
MLFMAVHQHPPERCPADDPAPLQRLTEEEHMRASGVRVLGSYIAPPEHAAYFLLEADDYAQVVRYFRPIGKIGTLRIVPVLGLQEALRVLSGH